LILPTIWFVRTGVGERASRDWARNPAPVVADKTSRQKIFSSFPVFDSDMDPLRRKTVETRMDYDTFELGA